jgi:hypothetical protein
MRRFNAPALGLAVALSAALAGPALADPPDTSFVRQHAIEMLEGSLTPPQIAKLQFVAHQAAIAAVCEGFVLDPAKVTAAFEALAPTDADKMNDAQKEYHDGHVLVIYGVLVGGEIAAMADDDGANCAAAADTKSDPEFADELVWQ